MRPTPGRMFFYIWRKQKIPSHQMNDSWGFNLFKI